MNATEQIDEQIKGLTGGYGKLMSKLRQLIHEADPEITEEWKWGTGVYTHGGMVCAVGAFKDHVKVNFFQGAVLLDPNKLFNSGLEAKKTRAIDIFETDTIDEQGLKNLIIAAVAYNNKK